jgi:6-phosphogluconolactonase
MEVVHTGHGDVRISRNLEALSLEAAQLFCDLAEKSIRQTGIYAVALSGGSTPKRLYQILCGPSFRDRIVWAQAHVFWSDERCVPPDASESNYRLANEHLLSRVPIPSSNIHRMHGEDDPSRAAAEYENDLRNFFNLAPGELPRFNLMLLGLGEEGHTASLFPNAPVLEEAQRLVGAPYVEKLGAYRLTLTLPVLNNSGAIAFLVSGDSKSAILKRVLEARTDDLSVPAMRVRPVAGQILWIVDEAAAVDLRQPLSRLKQRDNEP